MAERGSRPGIRWFGDRVFQAITGETENRMQRAVLHLENETKQLISRPGPLGKHATVRGRLPASEEGEPPHRRTGTLIRSVSSQVDVEGHEIIGRVGTNVRYGFWLEVGTSKMAARPWLTTGFDHEGPKLARILAGKG